MYNFIGVKWVIEWSKMTVLLGEKKYDKRIVDFDTQVVVDLV